MSFHVAIDTSGLSGSVGLLDCDTLIDQIDLPSHTGSAKMLAPAIAEVLKRSGTANPKIELVSVSVGPGSFTGLRVGIATAKTLAYAWKCKLAAVDTLEAIACQALTNASNNFNSGLAYIIPVVDAYRGQLFSALWKFNSLNFDDPCHSSRNSLRESQIIDTKLATELFLQWRDKESEDGVCRAGSKVALFVVGPAIKKLVDLPLGIQFLASDMITPGWPIAAATIGKIGYQIAQAGNDIDPFELLPNYLRKSAAEEKASQATA